FVKNGVIYLANGRQEQSVACVADIPLTLKSFAQHNIQNAVIAAAACWCQGLLPTIIRQGLMSFRENPGRLMLMSIGNFQVCVDYAHNPAGCQALVSTLRRLKPRRLIGVIAAPGDRRDDVIIRMGKTAGHGFDMLYLKEDLDLRGRQPGETAELLKRGALEAGLSPALISTVLVECEAVAAALAQAQDGDLVAVFYEDYSVVLDTITKFSNLERTSSNDNAKYQLVVAGVRVEG
ncbi:MAG: glutamate ligase domain-containing protein, partial [Sporomusa sp.]